MRKEQIKFRGKTINGEWVYGDLLRVGGGCVIYFGSKTETATPDIPNESNIAVELFNDEVAVVIPDTIGQYTGLKDKDGKEIYEGDILMLGSSDSGICEVKWNDKISAFCIRFSYERELGIQPLGVWCESERDIKLIGNIHSNPGLLKSE